MRLLAPPPRGTVTKQVHRGEEVFRAIGCAVCHRPEYGTGHSEFAALRYKNVRLFSDLLLHNVGTGDGIRQADARAFELRTPPLWGLRVRQLFMHDGATFTLAGAINRHAGEARRVTQRFQSLSSADIRRPVGLLEITMIRRYVKLIAAEAAEPATPWRSILR